MENWHLSYFEASLILTALLIVGFIIIACTRRTSAALRRRVSAQRHYNEIPTLDGSTLYYNRIAWPIYDARFNLRLSGLHGPIIRIEQGAKSFLGELVQILNSSFLYVTRQLISHADDTTILINSLEGDDGTLKRLLNFCASRAPSIAAGKYLSRGHRIVLMPYGPDWICHRKAFATLLTREKVRTLWAEALRVEAMVMVERLAGVEDDGSSRLDGKRVVDEVSRFTASTVLQIAYARRAAVPGDPILKDLEVVSRNIASAFETGRYWVETCAILDVFPAFISPWKRKLNADHRFEVSLFRDLVDDVERRLDGSYQAQKRRQAPEIITPVEQCAAAQLLRGQSCDRRLDRDAIAYLAAGLFEAGTETTAMTLNTFLLGAASNPEMTKLAQAEIDDLVASKYAGSRKNIIPDYEDLQGLPFLSAFVKEALRLTPAGASGVGHTFAGEGSQSFQLRHGGENPTSKRLDVPSGATVLANIYGLHHDSAMFCDPWRFNPMRWLPSADSDADHRQATLDHTYACFAFGFGKRICPGSSLACYSLTMAIAMLLLCFDFSLTDTATSVYGEMRQQVNDEYSAWDRLFGPRGVGVIEREKALKQGGYHSRDDEIGSVLIDAHVTFKLSRSQLGDCVFLSSRENAIGLAMVRKGLAALRS